MQKAKAFFLVCAGFFLLALSYHLGAQSATAQVGATGFGFAINSTQLTHYVMTPSGDVYARRSGGGPGDYSVDPQIYYVGNFWGGATASTPTTWGKVKADYRK